MRLMPKFMLPLLAVFLIIMGYFYGVWMPKLHDQAEAGYARDVSRHLDSITEGLVPLLLGTELDVIYENLDALKKTNPEWVSISLSNAEGHKLYPLIVNNLPGNNSGSHLLTFHKPISLGGQNLGILDVIVDKTAAIAAQDKNLFELGMVFAMLAFLLLLTMFLLLETTVLNPVRNLSRASKALARRDFDVPLPPVTKDEIGMLIEAFSTMRAARRNAEESLAHSNTELEQFAYAVSHDLREPLRMVSSYVTLLERRYAKQLDSDANEFIGFAKEGAKRMDQMIVDLLEYSRVGRRSGTFATFPLSEILNDALQLLSLRIDEVKAQVKIGEGFKSMPPLNGYPDELARLFLNLIGNALKYRKKDGPTEITVDGRTDPDGVVVSISDNGIGIAPQYFERIFQVFQRLHARSEYEGSGVGLATCKKIVEHHGGKIWVESAAGSGATFSFSLPLNVKPAGKP